MDFFQYYLKITDNKSTNRQMGLYSMNKLLHSKGNNQKGQETTSRMADNTL